MDFRCAGGWLRLAIDNAGGRAAVTSVAVQGAGGDWLPLHNSWGATWEAASAPQPPLSFRVSWSGAGVGRVGGVGWAGGRRRVLGGCGRLVPPPAAAAHAFSHSQLPSPPQLTLTPTPTLLQPSLKPARLWTMEARRWRRVTW